ncbi:MAG: hypothetical protein IKW71_00985 [Elusimicrobiaceae bacterium]|nr:hypothetical protein [Elusimicrobiaceae bacterium]
MKSIRLFCCLLATSLLSACAYHNKLPRDIFAAPAAEERVAASVLVCADQVAQKQFVLKDYHSQNSVHTYKIALADGSQIATAEALATLFDTVEVNPCKHSSKYTYYAVLHYTVGDGKTDSLDSIQWFGGQPPLLQTHVLVEIYNSTTLQKVFSMFASRQNRVEMSSVTAAAQRVENKGTALFLPFTGPVYTEQFGNNLNYTLSRDLSQCLEEIAQTLQQNRALFAPQAENNVK